MNINELFIIPICILLGINAFSNNCSAQNNTNFQQNDSSTQIKSVYQLSGKTTFLSQLSEIFKISNNKSVKISLMGDCMLASSKGISSAGSFNNIADKQPDGFFFQKALPYLKSDDFSLADCENVFTDQPLKEVEKGYTPEYWYKSSSKNAKIFSDNSIEAVTLANNHTMDYGQQGYNDTATALKNADVSITDYTKPLILEKDGVKIGVISLILGQGGIPATTLKQLKELKTTTDAIIVMFHGGEMDVHAPETWKVNACHTLIDNGADLVVGGHPHALQPFEVYKDKHIVYSLGNFCYGGSSRPENRTVLYQETFTFDSDNKLINQKENIIPFYVYTGSTNNYQPAPITDTKTKKQVLDFMYQKTKELVIN